MRLSGGADASSPARHDRIVIGLALQVLREAIPKTDAGKIDTVDVRLALRCLLPHCPERWPLTSFWSGAGGDNAIGRGATCVASLNGIELQLHAAERHPEPPTSVRA